MGMEKGMFLLSIPVILLLLLKNVKFREDYIYETEKF